MDALADLDAVIDQADVDSAYSTINKRSSSDEADVAEEEQLDEQERLEMERIMELEDEIAQLHRRSESRTSASIDHVSFIIKSKSNLHCGCVITPKRVTSGGVHRGLASG